MAGTQNIDRMGGLRKAMPVTWRLMTIGALALAAFPFFSGFFSKDEILGYAIHRGGFYVIFAIGGYIGALLTAFYAFRIGFRVVFGEPCEEARELEGGHIHHAEPQNPATGESEDTDVGFPGAVHWIAERALPMRAAMAVLAFLSIFAGLTQVPGVDDVISRFLEPTFEDSAIVHQVDPSAGAEWLGLAVGTVMSLTGIWIAYLVWVARPGTSAALQRRFAAVHTFLERKWYFDEAIDLLVVRPALALGRGANSIFERYVVQGLAGGTAGAVRGAGAAVRFAQSGYLRSYALLLVTGFAGLGLYFLVQS
jgi:NADH-quinone oxidoreductase subunit L